MARLGVLYEIPAARSFATELDKASKEIKALAAREVLETARLIARLAKAKAPFDKGDLRNAITFEAKGLNGKVGIDDRRIASRGGNNSAHLNPWVYGVWYEYGFVTRRISTQPYMRPAADAVEPSHVARMEAAVNASLAVAA